MTAQGIIYGIGLGPGDPDLMSVKARRVLERVDHLAYFRKRGAKGHARSIAAAFMKKSVSEFAMEYPITTELPPNSAPYRESLAAFYNESAAHLRALSNQGHEVGILCEGDPFFYGSFMHLYERLKDSQPIEVIPAITGMSAAWTATGQPITWGDDVLTVLAGTLPEEDLCRHIKATDALVVMKIGGNFDKICQALKDAGKYERAWMVEFASMEGQRILKLSDVSEGRKPYFSIIVVHGEGRRP